MKPPSEATAIKIAAALSAAPRWIVALLPADGGRFTWGDAPAWIVTSAVLSVCFCVVEVYAASFVMRAWRNAKPGTQPERVLFALWVSTLVVLVAVMSPPMFANVMRREFSALPEPLIAVWNVCVAGSTFLVVGGVGYAERRTDAPQQSHSAPDMRKDAPQDARTANADAAHKQYTCKQCDAKPFDNQYIYAAHIRHEHPKNKQEAKANQS